MTEEQKYLFSEAELKALALTVLATYVETIHFDLEVAEQTAELIAKLDEDFGKGQEWRHYFASYNREIADIVVDAILKGKKLFDELGEENNG